MKFMRLWVAVCVLVLAGQGVCAARTVEMRMAASFGEATVHTEAAREFARLAGEYSKGTVHIVVVLRSELDLGANEIFKAVKAGDMDAGDVFAGEAGAVDPLFGVSTLPMLVTDYERAREMYDLMRPFYESALDLHDLKLLYAAPWPPSGVFSDEPLSGPEDFKGLPMRVYDGNSREYFKALKAKPVIMRLGEVLFAWRGGNVEAALTSGESGMEHRYYDSFKHFSLLNFAYPLDFAVMNIHRWLALGKVQQEAVMRAASEAEAWQWSRVRERDARAVEFLAGRGVKVSEPSANATLGFQKAAVPLVRKRLRDGGDAFGRAWKAWREGRK